MGIEAEIEECIKSLNSKHIAPHKGYRRDVPIYELVCYVNNIIGCYLSRNIGPIKVFIERIKFYMDDNPVDERDKDYIEMVDIFLLQLANYLSHQELVDK